MSDDHVEINVNGTLAAEIVELLYKKTTGPGHAFATLCLCIKILQDLNAEMTGEPAPPLEQMVEEFRTSYSSIEETTLQ